jgi:hypothetical protein
LCKKCKKRFTTDSWRTFTTEKDFFALKDKLVETGKWEEFISFSVDKIKNQDDYLQHKIAAFTDWLINTPRFIELVNEWLKETEAK